MTASDKNALKKKAEEGCKEAQYELAEIYLESMSVLDTKLARRWMASAAVLGHKAAQARLIEVFDIEVKQLDFYDEQYRTCEIHRDVG
ncbi:MAG: hypothetical protein GC137_02680 [Alphaproteobacteria bacterium]|nr:hypothetical protein [Alphaproteobacteria bacterium]